MSEKTYDELEFTDDFLFCNILMANEDLCIELVEMITGRKIKSRKHEQWRLSYMLLEEKYKEKFDEGLKLGIERGHAEERQNTERESKRADDAETELGKAIAEIDILRTELETLKKAML